MNSSFNPIPGNHPKKANAADSCVPSKINAIYWATLKRFNYGSYRQPPLSTLEFELPEHQKEHELLLGSFAFFQSIHPLFEGLCNPMDLLQILPLLLIASYLAHNSCVLDFDFPRICVQHP